MSKPKGYFEHPDRFLLYSRFHNLYLTGRLRALILGKLSYRGHLCGVLQETPSNLHHGDSVCFDMSLNKMKQGLNLWHKTGPHPVNLWNTSIYQLSERNCIFSNHTFSCYVICCFLQQHAGVLPTSIIGVFCFSHDSDFITLNSSQYQITPRVQIRFVLGLGCTFEGQTPLSPSSHRHKFGSCKPGSFWGGAHTIPDRSPCIHTLYIL